MKKTVIVGTRGSILALRQTEIVILSLKEYFPLYDFKIKTIKTSGDINQKISLQDESVKSMFVKEIEQELLDGNIDFAVHSMKDMPNHFPEGLEIGSIPGREDNRDVLISSSKARFMELKSGAVIGTSSLRRKIQAERLRQDLIIKELRGNIHTRLSKLDNGEYDAIILAGAGLKRVGLGKRITQYFSEDEIMPAPCQGALCIEIRKNDEITRSIVAKINDPSIEKIVLAEKEFSKFFEGGCKVPIGASGKIIGGQLELTGIYFKNNKLIKEKITGEVEDYKKIVEILGNLIRRKIDG
jgi:hydroxymethylbilane synthase